MKKLICVFLSVTLLILAVLPATIVHSKTNEKVLSAQSIKDYNDFLKKYESKNSTRLLVISETKPDKLDSIGFLHCFGNNYLIQFENSMSAENALTFYKSQSSVISAEYDEEFNAGDAIGTGSGGISWGSEAIGYNSSFISKFKLSPIYAAFLPKVRVAVLDSGINLNNSTLNNRIERTNYNVSGSGDADSELDDYGHGTAVSSIIADNTPINVKIRAYKVINSSGKTSPTNVLYALQQAIDDGADIINISFSYSGYTGSGGLASLINEAYKSGILTVVSAGNEGNNASNRHPANVENALTVAAMREDGSIPSYSGYGKVVDLIAPGVEIKSYDQNSSSQYYSGCSFSAAFASAAAAIVKTKNQSATAQEISDFLVINGRDLNLPESARMFGAPALYLGNINSFNMIPRPANPVFSFESGTYIDNLSVSLTSPDDCDIYYEICNYNENERYSSPNNAAEYTAPIEINEKCNIVAVCRKEYPNITLESEIVFNSYFFDYTNSEDYFEIDENGTITEYKGKQSNVFVPETVDGITVTAIGDSVFEVKSSVATNEDKNFLRTIRLPDTCTTIGETAFELCYYLTEVDANNLQKIEDYAFDTCVRLESINLDNVRFLGRAALSGTKIMEINNNYLTSVGNSAFGACVYLESVYLPNVKRTNAYAFNGCSSVKELSFPVLEGVGANSFARCARLESIYLPKAKTIESSAFSYCFALENIEINNVEYIGKNAFFKNTSLKRAELPKVIEIEEDAFKSCESLREISFSNQLSYIGANAFENCTELTDVYFSGTKKEWEKIEIEENNECLKNANIHFIYYSTDNYTLLSAICEAKEYSNAEYTKESLESLNALVDRYASLVESGASQEAYDAATAEILNAIVNLDSLSNYTISTFNGKEIVLTDKDDKTTSLTFLDFINQNCESLDVVDDGIINAKDYAYLIKNYSL